MTVRDPREPQLYRFAAASAAIYAAFPLVEEPEPIVIATPVQRCISAVLGGYLTNPRERLLSASADGCAGRVSHD